MENCFHHPCQWWPWTRQLNVNPKENTDRQWQHNQATRRRWSWLQLVKQHWESVEIPCQLFVHCKSEGKSKGKGAMSTPIPPAQLSLSWKRPGSWFAHSRCICRVYWILHTSVSNSPRDRLGSWVNGRVCSDAGSHAVDIPGYFLVFYPRSQCLVSASLISLMTYFSITVEWHS